jgi:dihydrofolate reductase
MATVLYSATASLDGFIAGPGGDMSWLTRYLGPNLLDEVLVCIAPVLLGDGVRLFDHPGGATVALEGSA